MKQTRGKWKKRRKLQCLIGFDRFSKRAGAKVHPFSVLNKDKGTDGEFDSSILEPRLEAILAVSNKMEDKFSLCTSMMDVHSLLMTWFAGLEGLVRRSFEQVIKLIFVNGFLSDILTALQQLHGAENMLMSNLLMSTRVLAVNRAHELGEVATTKQGPVQPEKFISQCFRCKGPYMIRDSKAPSQQGIICYSCGELGDIAVREKELLCCYLLP